MARPLSRIAPDWWDSTTPDAEIIRDAAALGPEDLVRLSRPGRPSALCVSGPVACRVGPETGLEARGGGSVESRPGMISLMRSGL